MKLCIKIRKHEQSGFVASCPSLPGCVMRGQTEEQAKERIEEAIRGYLASVNDFVPEQIQEVLEMQT